MKFLIPFVVAAALVVMLVVNALRDDPVVETRAVVDRVPVEQKAQTPTVQSPVTQVAVTPEQPDEGTDSELVDNADLMTLLRDFGFGQLEKEWRDWAMTRGYPALDATGGNTLYDQPYDQYDDDVLRGLANNGDMWAQQILAKRLANTNPAEAMELYRQAAINGSIYAMSEMAGLYARIADSRREAEFKTNELALEQVYAMRDSPVSPEVTGYAWTAVAELAGTEPMFGNIAASQFGRSLTKEEMDEGCQMARGLYDEITAQRSAQGLGDFDRKPPPIVYWDPKATASCDDTRAPRLDLSGCRKVETDEGGQIHTVWLCSQ